MVGGESSAVLVEKWHRHGKSERLEADAGARLLSLVPRKLTWTWSLCLATIRAGFGVASFGVASPD